MSRTINVSIPSVAAAATLGAAALASAACEERKPGAEDPPSRVNASKTQARQGATPEAFCDAYFPPGKGPALKWPAMAPGPGAATPANAGWRWINVWATWCKPCIEEMPRLRGWREKLTTAGKPFELAFVSVDESDAEVAAFRKAHPDAPPSMRLAEPGKYLPWFHDLGLPGEPPIPVHFVVDPSGQVRCARAGGVREQDYAVIEKLLGG
jgi:thiol-disulfide isomerase/thioredoxin